jgi:hypothetical protein
MVKITKMISTELSKEVKIETENFYQIICDIIMSSLSNEVQSNKEFLFIITIKRRVLLGVHVVNIGSARESIVDYRGLIKYALDDNADEVIICHNHLIVVDDKADEKLSASDYDLIVFSNIFCTFSLMNIYSVCCIISSDMEHISFYYPHGEYSFVKESGWKERIIKKNRKTYIEKIPYVKSDIKEITFNQAKFKRIRKQKDDNKRRKTGEKRKQGQR